MPIHIKNLRQKKLLIYITAMFFCAKILSAEITRSNGSIIYKNKDTVITFRDPAAPRADDDCRFSSAAWISSWQKKGRELLCVKSVFSWHPAYGLPEEFAPVINVSIAEADKADFPCPKWEDEEIIPTPGLRIGVGFVWQYPGVSFKNKALRFLPWKVMINKNSKSGIQISFRQEAEGFYELIKEVFINADDIVSIKEKLIWKNARGCKGMVLLHPFFPSKKGDKNWYLIATENKKRTIPIPEKHNFTRITKGLPKQNIWTCSGNNYPFICFCSSPKINALSFWRKKGCFAVEPEIYLSLKKGDVKQWTWKLKGY